MNKRPTPQETDEDLLRLQEEFMKQYSSNNKLLGTTVVAAKKDETKEDSMEIVDPMDQEIQERLDNTFEIIPSTENVGEINERKVDAVNIVYQKFDSTTGFPKARRRNNFNTANATGRSIFAQQMQGSVQKPLLNKPIAIKENITSHTSVPNQARSDLKNAKRKFPGKSVILQGSDKSEIEQENRLKLSSMTEEEILRERENLLSTMDPAIVRYLRSLRNKEENQDDKLPTVQEKTTPKGTSTSSGTEMDEPETSTEILRDPNADKWLNFNAVEAHKLSWMKDVDIPKLKKSEAYEARFDFEGWLMPFSEPEFTEKNRPLYHHGEEPGRPGYTLQELFQLTRSNVLQQKIVALNSIANILSLHSSGVYDDLTIPLEQIFFVVRYSLDDNTPSVLNASVRAMRNLVCSKIDETCLDCLIGFGHGQSQPILAISNEKDDTTVNDQQVVETNLIQCLVRTDILSRIRYIINTVKPPIETISYCMDVLIRLARDAPYIVDLILNSDIIKSTIHNFVPNVDVKLSETSSYGSPLTQSVKLLRLLICRSKHIAVDLLKKYGIAETITTYLLSENYSSNSMGLRLQIECFRFLNVLVSYNMEYFPTLCSTVFAKLLVYHLERTDLHMSTTFIKIEHASTFMVLLGSLLKKKSHVIDNLIPLIRQCLIKWTRQCAAITKFVCGKLQLISSSYYCMSAMPDQFYDELLQKLLTSPAFSLITKTVKNGSMLLNNYETHKSGSNLKTLEAAAWNTSEHIIPLIQTNSPIPFLSTLSSYVEATDNQNVKQLFLQHRNIASYIDSIRRNDSLYLINNWFTQVESKLLLNIIKISAQVPNSVDTSLLYEFTIKCLGIFTIQQKNELQHILANIVFNPRFYPFTIVDGSLPVDKTDVFKFSTRNLQDIFKVYVEHLGIDITNPDHELTQCVDVNIGSIVPVDWIYTPIISLYAEQQQNKSKLVESQQLFIVRNCLKWIYFYESYFPKLAAFISPTDRFCRLACVFLANDSLFLVNDVHDLLEGCLRNLIQRHQSEINFNKEIHGLTDFQTFYTQLLEQYQGVSYGDVLFGNFILVPLAQRHKPDWRKTLWSEFMGVVEVFTVTTVQSICSMESFLLPPEADMSLLRCYGDALYRRSQRPRETQSVLYNIAEHHVRSYRNRNKT